MKHKKFVLVCSVLVIIIVLFFIGIKNLPLKVVDSRFNDPDSIHELYIEITGNQKSEEATFSIDDEKEIKTICGYLEDTCLEFKSTYSTIPFNESGGDPIIVIHINGDHENTVYLKADGSFYTSNFRFMDKGRHVSALVEYIIKSNK